MWVLFATFAVFGHIAFCIWTINRLHSTALPHYFVRCIDLVWYPFAIIVPAAVVYWLTHGTISLEVPNWSPDWNSIAPFAIAYGVFSCGVACFTAVVWYHYFRELATTELLKQNHTAVIDVKDELGARPVSSLVGRCATKLPGNQIFELSVHRKTIEIPRLPAALDGMTICHISDLHFTGRVTRDYFDFVVEQANQLNSDLVAITGDIVDKRRCMPWLNDVLGKLQAKLGICFVLGNHDLRVHDEVGVRRAMTDNGHFDLGGRWNIMHHNDHPILFGGNELPWFNRTTDMRECPIEIDGKVPFRILLSHSPDQIEWARANDFDLMLAGHTHGGQIRFPVVGPIFAPSRYGVKYASGTFFVSPTLLHVSRGLSGTRLMRWNCRPELAQLILKTPGGASSVGRAKKRSID